MAETRYMMWDRKSDYFYWSSHEVANNPDCPHYTGQTEEAMRAMAEANPAGTAAEAVRQADAWN